MMMMMTMLKGEQILREKKDTSSDIVAVLLG
jgi:hypothetical protein